MLKFLTDWLHSIGLTNLSEEQYKLYLEMQEGNKRLEGRINELSQRMAIFESNLSTDVAILVGQHLWMKEHAVMCTSSHLSNTAYFQTHSSRASSERIKNPEGP